MGKRYAFKWNDSMTHAKAHTARRQARRCDPMPLHDRRRILMHIKAGGGGAGHTVGASASARCRP
jgi:hypothetical protein